jgi:hypothetical protein
MSRGTPMEVLQTTEDGIRPRMSDYQKSIFRVAVCKRPTNQPALRRERPLSSHEPEGLGGSR